MKTLTAFFSAGGYTASLAQRVAEAAESDLFRIEPEVPYTEADIRWTNPLARCNKEKIGRKDVAIAETVPNFEDYDMVYLGFPIWYYGAPNIIQTFCSSYDWTGKKVALFATSGGSSIGKTMEKLRPYFRGEPELVSARVFPAPDDLQNWAEEMK